MKKFLFALVLLMCGMCMNAQIVRIVKNGTVVKTYTSEEFDQVVFEEEVEPGELTPPSIVINEDGVVTLSHYNETGTIYYTIDGTDPTEESTKYSAPFTVEEGTEVKAQVMDETSESKIRTKIYIPCYFIGPGTYDNYEEWDTTGWYKNNVSLTGSAHNPITTIPTPPKMSDGIGIKCPKGYTISLQLVAAGFSLVHEQVLWYTDSKYDYYMIDATSPEGIDVTKIDYRRK